ncbi:MAG: DUF929 family protein [Candidatus Micrarchaeia archaeon]
MDKLYAYVLLTIVVAAGLIILAYIQGASAATSSLSLLDNVLVNSSVINALHLSNNTFSLIGIGDSSNFPQKVIAPALNIGSKPTIVYIGANFCPYCAVERWSLILALLRFGNFTGLKYMTSSPTDFPPNLPTFTFYNSTYESKYINFIPVELYTNKEVNGSYPVLQQPNSLENAILSKFDPSENIPIIDYNNNSIQKGAGSELGPSIIENLNWTQIISQLSESNSSVAQEIIGEANIVTAEICGMDNNTPVKICGQAYVKRVEAAIS